MVDGTQISVDELLLSQRESGLRATLEAIDSDESRVKVTPYMANLGCLCSIALNVPKAAIEALVKTSATHDCCGKLLSVVEVIFADKAYADAFSQLIKVQAVGGGSRPSAIQESPDPHSPVAPPSGSQSIWSELAYETSRERGPMRVDDPHRQECLNACTAEVERSLKECFYSGAGSLNWCLCVAKNTLGACRADCTGRRHVPTYCIE
ncbi:hypothetical protein [Streptomyces doebereineriae]|uniref:Uncharacterized protein n=1 Tax=Streptomyces doebereineriae TaxID=3075528 RepID=A0ABU2VID9_9ACTN|nr:hypothetical protein [Streptomyces sp. DSM 41640]MDT0485355.1 hypothetical protein [Streptomyces sp. DSM 41640]